MNICDGCGVHITGTTVVLSSLEEHDRGTYCLDCNNQIVAEHIGISYKKEEFTPYRISDAYGVEHTFVFEVHFVPAGISIYASESFLDSEDEGHRFEELGEFDCHPRELHAKLLQKMHKALQRSHFEIKGSNKSLKDVVRGRIGYNYDSDGAELVIDGQAISWDDFGRMLDTYEGFQFRLEFIDPSDEVE